MPTTPIRARKQWRRESAAFPRPATEPDSPSFFITGFSPIRGQPEQSATDNFGEIPICLFVHSDSSKDVRSERALHRMSLALSAFGGDVSASISDESIGSGHRNSSTDTATLLASVESRKTIRAHRSSIAYLSSSSSDTDCTGIDHPNEVQTQARVELSEDMAPAAVLSKSQSFSHYAANSSPLGSPALPSSTSLLSDCTARLLHQISRDSFSTLETPIFAPPSFLSMADTLLSWEGRPGHFRPARAERYRNVGEQAGLHENGTAVTLNEHVNSKAVDKLSPGGEHATIMPLARVVSHDCNESLNIQGFSWLKNTALELLIDQEAFRSIRPIFRLARFIHKAPSDEDPNTVSAVFKPTKREPHVFHYGSLDRPPTLRRLSIQGDETRDYLSRQASLTLKANGVYSIRGVEEHKVGTHIGHHHNACLSWKLDYMVDDRRADATGRVLPGEKIITLMSFSCTPTLLDPSRGAKVNLIQTMKKGLAQKVIAERIVLPFLHIKRPAAHALRAATDQTVGARDVPSSTEHSGPVHADAVLDPASIRQMQDAITIQSSARAKGIVQDTKPVVHGRSKSDSISGGCRPDISTLSPNAFSYAQAPRPSPQALVRPIIPREELMKILEPEKAPRPPFVNLDNVQGTALQPAMQARRIKGHRRPSTSAG